MKVLAILAMLFIAYALTSNFIGTQQSPATDAVAIDTTVTAVPPPQLRRGIRRYNPAPFHARTRTSGPGGGAGVDMLLTSVIVRDRETLVTFDIRSDHYDAILYDRLYLIVDGGTTLQSTNGLEGGRQSNFNDVDSIQRIDFLPGEHVVLVARFPQLPDDARTLQFVFPTINGLQDGWQWNDIEVREIEVLPEQP